MSVRNIWVSLVNQVYGLLGLAHGGTNVDLSATGGTSQVLKQVTAGAAITVGQLAASDLSNGTTGSGAVVLASTPTFPNDIVVDANTYLGGTIVVPQPAGNAVFALDNSASAGQSVNNNATITPIGNADNFSGLIIFNEYIYNGTAAVFLCAGGHVVLVSQTLNTYSTTQGNVGTYNVYLAASVLTLENKLGFNSAFKVMAFRLRDSE